MIEEAWEMGDKKDLEQQGLRAERRRFVRVSIYAIARYFCPTRDHEVGVQSLISDISEGGVFLVTLEEGIPVGSKVKIIFLLPTEKEMTKLEGRVRHTGLLETDHYRCGLEFTRIKEKDRAAVRRYIAANYREHK